MRDFGQIIPEKDSAIEIHPFNDTEYLIQHTILKFQIKVNELTIKLLELVDGIRSIEEIRTELLVKHNIDATSQSLYSILYSTLSTYGIIKRSDIVIEKRKKATYLRLSFIFFKEQWVRSIASYLKFLYKKWIFLSLIVSATLFIALTYYSNYSTITANSRSLVSLNIVLYFIMFRIGSIFHELGHATACLKFGAKHGGIGFGFYLFIPVLFVDVSDIWKLPAKKRLVVNMGGIYFEMIIASICLIFFHFNNELPFLIIPTFMILSTLYNLNPLLRYDGYWVLVDLVGVPNLKNDAQRELISFINNVLRFKPTLLTRRKLLLIIYGILSSIWIVLLLASMLYFDPYAIRNFPIDIATLSSCLFNSFEPNCLDNPLKLVVPLIFYIILIRMLIGPLFKYISQLLKDNRVVK